MDAMSGTDVAIGWGLILTAALACFYGIPFLIEKLVRGIAASAEQERLRRELVQEDLDEQLRVEMLAWAEQEQRDAAVSPGPPDGASGGLQGKP